jgi:plastocyanin
MLTMAGAKRTVLLLGVLCLGASCAAATIAIAAPGRSPAHVVHACRRHVKRRRCRKPRSGKHLRRKHQRTAPKSSLPGEPGTNTSLTAPPAAVIPGAKTGAGGGASSGSAGADGGAAPAGGGAPVTANGPAAPAGPAHVQVTAEDSNGYHFILSRTAVPAGEVVIEFVNHGQDEHNIHAVEPAAGTEAGGLAENALPGTHTDLTLDLRAGSYTLFCSLPGHEAKGMKATLTVE